MKGEKKMEVFNIICGVCSIAGLLVSVFTATKIIKISNNLNYGNSSNKTTIKTKVGKSKVEGAVVGGIINERKDIN